MRATHPGSPVRVTMTLPLLLILRREVSLQHVGSLVHASLLERTLQQTSPVDRHALGPYTRRVQLCHTMDGVHRSAALTVGGQQAGCQAGLGRAKRKPLRKQLPACLVPWIQTHGIGTRAGWCISCWLRPLFIHADFIPTACQCSCTRSSCRPRSDHHNMRITSCHCSALSCKFGEGCGLRGGKWACKTSRNGLHQISDQAQLPRCFCTPIASASYS
jgi:hypothetical protein